MPKKKKKNKDTGVLEILDLLQADVPEEEEEEDEQLQVPPLKRNPNERPALKQNLPKL